MVSPGVFDVRVVPGEHHGDGSDNGASHYQQAFIILMELTEETASKVSPSRISKRYTASLPVGSVSVFIPHNIQRCSKPTRSTNNGCLESLRRSTGAYSTLGQTLMIGMSALPPSSDTLVLRTG